MAVLKHRLATTPSIKGAFEVAPPNLEAVSKLQKWLAEQRKAPIPTQDMLQLYSQSEVLSHHISVTIQHELNGLVPTYYLGKLLHWAQEALHKPGSKPPGFTFRLLPCDTHTTTAWILHEEVTKDISSIINVHPA